MQWVFKTLVYLCVFATIGLIAFAYLGPMLGFDFSAPQTQTRLPVELTTD